MQNQFPQLPYIEMSVAQYAADKGVSETTVRRWCESKAIDAYKLNEDVGGRGF